MKISKFLDRQFTISYDYTYKIKCGEIRDLNIRPPRDLRNKYNEISKQYKEIKEDIITVNSLGNTVLLGLQDCKKIKAELELLRDFAGAEDEVQNGKVDYMQKSFNDFPKSLIDRRSENV